jgi:hypothetical protein
MNKWAKLIVSALTLVSLCFCSSIYAENLSNELQEGRYILIMMTGRATINIRIPAMVLDSYNGIVWTCQNLQDGKPLWVKVDLAKNGDKQITKKKYIARMLEFQDADLRMPAIVLDIEEGIVWNCPNIVDGKATWIKKDLKADFQGVEKINESIK